MKNNNWSSKYQLSSFDYTLLLGYLILLIALSLINPFNSNSLRAFFIALIAIVVFTLFWLIQLQKISRYESYKIFEKQSIESVSSSIKDLLNDNHFEFSMIRNYLTKTIPKEKFDFYYDAKKNNFAIGIIKMNDRNKSICISIRFKENTDSSLIELLKNKIDGRSNHL